jgi:hypothetical protein
MGFTYSAGRESTGLMYSASFRVFSVDFATEIEEFEYAMITLLVGGISHDHCNNPRQCGAYPAQYTGRIRIYPRQCGESSSLLLLKYSVRRSVLLTLKVVSYHSPFSVSLVSGVGALLIIKNAMLFSPSTTFI